MGRRKIMAGLAVVGIAAVLVCLFWKAAPEESASSTAASPAVPRAPSVAASPQNTADTPAMPSRATRVALPTAAPATNLADAPTPTAPPRVSTPLTTEQTTAIRNNLRQFASAAQEYMEDKGVVQVRYQDIAGTTTEAYIRPIRPVADEDYGSLILFQSQSEISITTPDGISITFDE